MPWGGRFEEFGGAHGGEIPSAEADPTGGVLRGGAARFEGGADASSECHHHAADDRLQEQTHARRKVSSNDDSTEDVGERADQNGHEQDRSTSFQEPPDDERDEPSGYDRDAFPIIVGLTKPAVHYSIFIGTQRAIW